MLTFLGHFFRKKYLLYFYLILRPAFAITRRAYLYRSDFKLLSLVLFLWIFAISQSFRKVKEKCDSDSLMSVITLRFPASSYYHLKHPKSVLAIFLGLFWCHGYRIRVFFNNRLNVYLSTDHRRPTEIFVPNMRKIREDTIREVLWYIYFGYLDTRYMKYFVCKKIQDTGYKYQRYVYKIQYTLKNIIIILS